MVGGNLLTELDNVAFEDGRKIKHHSGLTLNSAMDVRAQWKLD
jgi:hypothetical protein